MGNIYGTSFLEGRKPAHIPLTNETPSYPPDFGFKAPRKVRESKYTPEELRVLPVPEKRKNYCADKVVEFMKCMRKYSQFTILCQCQRHAMNQCQIEDEILRMKEYEREKRLRLRDLKIQQQQAAAAS